MTQSAYAEHFEEVTVEMHTPRHRSVHIEPMMFESIRLVAQSRGISTETLINLWLMERLRSVQRAFASATKVPGEVDAAGEEEGAKAKG